jgi:uncharacterized OB-fold protein
MVTESDTLLSAGFPVLPAVNERNRHFWEGGRDGKLVFLRCQKCGYYIHPPTPICPKDGSKDVSPEPVSGRATLASFTVNYQAWLPSPELPYVIGLVEIAEQEGLRLTTNLVNCAPESVRIGMDVQVVFAHRTDPSGDVWIPYFEPVGEA